MEALVISTSIKKPQIYNKPALVESLPPEIGLLILHQIPDRGTLRNLILASPTYHSLYLTAREEILTPLTIRQLISRGFDPFSQCNVIETFIGNRKDNSYSDTNLLSVGGSIWIAARKLYEQCQRHSLLEGRGKRNIIKTDISTCQELLNIRDSKSWLFDYTAGTKQVSVDRISSQWNGLHGNYLYGRANYHVMVLADWPVDLRLVSTFVEELVNHMHDIHVRCLLGKTSERLQWLGMERVVVDDHGF